MVWLAVATFSSSNCKDINVKRKSEGPVSVIENVLSGQNETAAMLASNADLHPAINDTVITYKNKTTALQKNSTSSVVRQKESDAERDHLKPDRQPKTRQVPAVDALVTSGSTVMDDSVTYADQLYYQSPLMVYPFPMMNTYYPRYFPYTYPGYQGTPFFG